MERDALDISMAGYTADRRSLRERRKKTSTGQRNIEIKVAVREPQVWERHEVKEELHRLFEWMSGDCWTIELIPCRGLKEEDIGQEYLFATQPEAPAAVSLLSGGLDSLAGFAGQLGGQIYRSHVLASAYTNSRQRAQQTRLVDIVAETLRDRRTNWPAQVGTCSGANGNKHEAGRRQLSRCPPAFAHEGREIVLQGL